jgi:hypothetical protein
MKNGRWILAIALLAVSAGMGLHRASAQTTELGLAAEE